MTSAKVPLSISEELGNLGSLVQIDYSFGTIPDGNDLVPDWEEPIYLSFTYSVFGNLWPTRVSSFIAFLAAESGVERQAMVWKVTWISTGEGGVPARHKSYGAQASLDKSSCPRKVYIKTRLPAHDRPCTLLLLETGKLYISLD